MPQPRGLPSQPRGNASGTTHCRSVHGASASSSLSGTAFGSSLVGAARVEGVLCFRRPEPALVVLWVPRLPQAFSSCRSPRLSRHGCDDTSRSVVHTSGDGRFLRKQSRISFAIHGNNHTREELRRVDKSIERRLGCAGPPSGPARSDARVSKSRLSWCRHTASVLLRRSRGACALGSTRSAQTGLTGGLLNRIPSRRSRVGGHLIGSGGCP